MFLELMYVVTMLLPNMPNIMYNEFCTDEKVIEISAQEGQPIELPGECLIDANVITLNVTEGVV